MSHLLLAYTLILIGLALMAAELVLFSHGVLSMIGLGGIIVGAVMVFGSDRTLGVITLLGLFVIVPICGRIVFNLWPNTPMGRNLCCKPAARADDHRETPGSREPRTSARPLRENAVAVRPAGAVDFDGRRIDAMSEGDLDRRGPVGPLRRRAGGEGRRPASPNRRRQSRIWKK